MKLRPAFLTAALFCLVSCDGEKVKEAKKEIGEAGAAVGEAGKEVGGKVFDKAKALGKQTVEGFKVVKEAVADHGGPAMDNFKTKLRGLSDLMKKSQNQSTEDPAVAIDAMSRVTAQAKAISAEGLPEDVKTALQRYQQAMVKILAVVKTMPPGKEERQQWEVGISEKLKPLEDEVTAATKLLKEAAAKHGLTGLDLGTEP